MICSRRLTCAGLLLVATLGGCRRRNEPSLLLVVITIEGSPAPVVALDVAVSSSAGTSTRRYSQGGGRPIVFPTTLTAELSPELSSIAGALAVDVTAFDAVGGTVARGRTAAIVLRPGSTQTISVGLGCASTGCGADGGATDGAMNSDGPPSDAPMPTCGNGKVDLGEACDTAIAAGQPGACPRLCDDGVACSTDTLVGNGCAATCVHTDFLTRVAGDGCCPTGATNTDDPDCTSTCGDDLIQPTETCDVAIAAGRPGACPGRETCVSNDPCTTTLLVSEATCHARCLRYPVTAPSGLTADGCCPSGASAGVDVDCPALCGNGLLERDEMCDPAIPAGAPGACPASCDDGNPCTADHRTGAGCQATCTHTPITSFTSGDGCCPSGGASHNLDSDCAAVCGNGTLEEGEACDLGAASPVPCPTSCPASPSACLKRVLTGDREHCSAQCAVQAVTTCSSQKDGCCPAGCTAATDGDCGAGCGDGVVTGRLGETCDTAITTGPGRCPTSCSDGLACTSDRLVSAGTCQATCVFIPITAFVPGDACCPTGGHFAVDPDCTPVCGNGIVEAPAESCDFAAGPAACPTVCPPVTGCAAFVLQGGAGGCDARCVAATISDCASGDGCCPPGCSSLDDNDCPALCGNGVVEPGEACDRAITAGAPGACAESCDDQDSCTVDFASGSVAQCTRRCSHAAITECQGGDRCCPTGCGAANDLDCGSGCGDGIIGGGETCDPPSSCPTTCPDDGDRCTTEELTGNPARCTAACAHVPVTTCSGTTSDRCCPTGCDPIQDTDC